MTGEQQRVHLYTCTKPANHPGACDDVQPAAVPERPANPCYPASANVQYHPLGGMCPDCGHTVALHSMRRACAACELLTIGPASPMTTTGTDPPVDECPDCRQKGRYDGRVLIGGRGMYVCPRGHKWQDALEKPTSKGIPITRLGE